MMAWDTIQRKLQCCGIDGPRNWYDINNGTADGIPASCCRPQYIDRETQNCKNAAPLYMDRLFTVRIINFIQYYFTKYFFFILH